MSEKLKVLIVDDSAVFRSQIRAALENEADIEVVGFATNGRMACDVLKTKKVDVMTLDLEMPIMGGLDTLKELSQQEARPHVLVFSAHTKSGAEATLSALQLGASDFLLKPTLDSNSAQTPAEVIKSILLPKISLFKDKIAPVNTTVRPVVQTTVSRFPKLNLASFNPSIVVLASSTGGPAALERLFTLMRPPLNCPMLIAQHMPPIFTAALAERLQRVSGIEVVEATQNMPLVKGKVYVAPGDYHMRVKMVSNAPTVILDQEPLRNSVRPAADYLFESVTEIYNNSTLGIVLTGMGADGKDGAVAVKKAGGGVFIQDKESCIVFGMPGAVYQENAFDKMGRVEEIAQMLTELSLCSIAKAG